MCCSTRAGTTSNAVHFYNRAYRPFDSPALDELDQCQENFYDLFVGRESLSSSK